MLNPPKYAKSHDENRAKVCLICFQKHPPKSMRSAESPVQLKRIKEYFLENYCPSDLKMPSGLCCNCKKILHLKEAKKLGDEKISEVSIPDPVDFSKLHFPPTITRSRGGDLVNCDCDICLIAIENVGTNPSKFGKISLEVGQKKKFLNYQQQNPLQFVKDAIK